MINKQQKNISQLRLFGPKVDAYITIPHKTLMEYQHLVHAVAPNEVQWYAFVDRKITTHNNTQPDSWRYHIDGLIIPKQTVSPGEVDTSVKDDPTAMMCIYQELKNKHADNSEFGYNQDAVNHDITCMHVWCHSHPFSENPQPSGTDDEQFKTWVENNQLAQGIDTPMVALIFGKGNKIHARVYDPKRPGLYLDKMPVITLPPTDLNTEYIEEAIKNKITKQPKVFWTAFSHSPRLIKKNGVWVQQQKSAKAKKETDPNKFFEKNFPKNWKDFVEKFNSIYDNAEEVKILWTFLCTILKNDLERTIFINGLVETFSELRLLEEKPHTKQLMKKDDCLLILTEFYTTYPLVAKEIEIALKFTKRYCAATSTTNRALAIENLINNITEFQNISTKSNQIHTNSISDPIEDLHGYNFINSRCL